MTISGDYFWIGLVFLAIFFTWYAGRRRHILIALISFTLWMSMAMWLFLSDTPPIDGLSNTWVQILAWGFFSLAWLPWMLQMDIEIQHESQGRRWTDYGLPPREKPPRSYEEYARRLRERLRR